MATLEELLAIQGELDQQPQAGSQQAQSAPVGELLAIQQEMDSAPRLKGSLTQEQFQSEFGDVPDVLGLVEAQQPKQSATIGENLIGIGETALTVGSGMTSGTVGALVGTLDGVIQEIKSGEFGTSEAARRIGDRASELMQMLTIAPKTEAGQDIAQSVGEVGASLAPLTGLGGQAAQIGRAAKLAAPSVKAGAQALSATPRAQEAVNTGLAIFKRQSPTKQRIARLIEEGSADIDTARFSIDTPRIPLRPGDTPQSATSSNRFARLKSFLDVEGPKIKTDSVAVETIKQGFDEGVVAAIKASSPADQAKMLKMTKIMERGKQNKRFAAENRPSDVVGDSLMDRFRVIRKANTDAGRRIRKAASDIKGKPVDLEAATNGFAQSLDDLGVRLVPDNKGNFKPDFEFSQLSPGDRGPMKEVIRQMNIRGRDGAIDGLTAHKMKKIIDNNVTFGKVKTGISGDAERALKGFRSSINKALGDTFPEYGKQNKIYSETIGVLDTFQDIAGRKLNLSGENVDKSVGTMMRGLLSNNKTRIRLLDSVNEIEAAAKKFGVGDKKLLPGKGLGSDDLLNQILFADELDSRFGPAARTSLAGEVGKEIQRGAQVVRGGAFETAVEVTAKGIEKARGINDKAAFKSMKELLKKGKK
jgi:hypothetical protein